VYSQFILLTGILSQEWRHAHGMRCLGIPNTAHFANVTQIEDALACKCCSYFSSHVRYICKNVLVCNMIPNMTFDSRVAINDGDRYEYHVLWDVIHSLLWTSYIEVTPSCIIR